MLVGILGPTENDEGKNYKTLQSEKSTIYQDCTLVLDRGQHIIGIDHGQFLIVCAGFIAEQRNVVRLRIVTHDEGDKRTWG